MTDPSKSHVHQSEREVPPGPFRMVHIVDNLSFDGRRFFYFADEAAVWAAVTAYTLKIGEAGLERVYAEALGERSGGWSFLGDSAEDAGYVS